MNDTGVVTKFIAAGNSFSTRTSYVPAPLFRKQFTISPPEYNCLQSAELVICVCGLYEAYINGKNVTKGLLAPYFSALDQLRYYDRMDIKEQLREGENVIGVWLGNGLRNDPGGAPWGFDKASWRGSPCFSLKIYLRFKNGETRLISSDESFRTSPSPILFDDYRIGEVYDAAYEQEGWNLPAFDDSDWNTAIHVMPPKGELTLCTADPIRITAEHKPVRISRAKGGWLFDFGLNSTGVVRLKIDGRPGQRITLHHGECVQDGILNLQSTTSDPSMETNVDTYICRGGMAEYQPRFTYHGFQYVLAEGLLDEQVLEDTLTFVEFHSDIPERGDFTCSLGRANRIQEAARRSTASNFQYFPNDCPQREKNGWTGDAAISAEHTLLNFEAERSYQEWMRNVRKAQTQNGSLPGIVPTAGWGYGDSCHSPAWDCVLTEIPYQIYKYRGDSTVFFENEGAIFAYLQYLSARRRSDGLLIFEEDGFGLGDWAQVGHDPMGIVDAPLETVHTLMALDSCAKAEFLYREHRMEERALYAQCLKNGLREAARRELIDKDRLLVRGNCQTSQTLGLAFDVFEENERAAALQNLLAMIHEAGDRMDVGVIGGRYLFHVLSEFGYSDLAFFMIARPDYPSYGNWIERGATTLWEEFQPEDGPVHSRNHHFWGNVSHWFISCVAGIQYSRKNGKGCLNVRPAFIRELQWAEAWHRAPEGRISVRWESSGSGLKLLVTAPETLEGEIILPAGFSFSGGMKNRRLEGGTYEIIGQGR